MDEASAPAKGTVTRVPASKEYSFPDEAFDEQYMPDDFGEEASDYARVWKVYREEARPRDVEKLGGWNRTFDVLLTFAGLYSAALTAFLVESYKSLKQDSSEYTADILFRLISLQPFANITPSDIATDAIRAPDKGYTPTTSMLLVNGLWFTSLALTLAVAFLCILAKQRLSEHERMLFDRSIPARKWTRTHVYRSRALLTWFPRFVSALPTMLHIALFLFLAGLFVFLLELNNTIAGLFAAIGAPVLLFFIVRVFAPLWSPSRAWRLLFGRLIRHSHRAAVAPLSPKLPAHSRLPSFRADAEGLEPSAVSASTPSLSSVARGAADGHTPGATSIVNQASDLEAVALRRLLRSPTHNVVATAIQAIGAMETNGPTIEALRLPGSGDYSAVTRIRSYIIFRSKDRTSYGPAERLNVRLLYEAVHCYRAWASLTQLKSEFVGDKSIFHNLYHIDPNFPLDVQVIIALMSDLTPVTPGDTNYEFSDIAAVFRGNPYDPRSFRLHPSTLRLVAAIIGDNTTRRENSRRLGSELAVLHGLLSICLVSWMTDPKRSKLPADDYLKVCVRITRRLEHWRGGTPRPPPPASGHPTISYAISGYIDLVTEQPVPSNLVYMWLAFSRFWLETPTFGTSYVQHPYVFGPNPGHIAESLILLCRRLNESEEESEILGKMPLFWDVLLHPQVECHSWTLEEIDDLLHVYLWKNDAQSLYPDGRVLAALLRMAGRCLNLQVLQERRFSILKCFKVIKPTLVVELGNEVSLQEFLGDHNGACAWRVLHSKICSDGKANGNVLKIAKSLSRKLETSSQYTKAFFSDNALEHCFTASYEEWLSAFEIAVRTSSIDEALSLATQALKSQLSKCYLQEECLDLCHEFVKTSLFTEATRILAEDPFHPSLIDIICACTKVSREETASAFRKLVGDDENGEEEGDGEGDDKREPKPKRERKPKRDAIEGRSVPQEYIDFLAFDVYSRLSPHAPRERNATTGHSTHELIDLLRGKTPGATE